jgi:prevent-host-death family protein
MTVMPLVEVKNHLSEVVSSVERTHERVTVTRNGRPAAIILSPDDLEALEETLAVLADAELSRQLSESADDRKVGRTVSADELADAMRHRRSPE